MSPIESNQMRRAHRINIPLTIVVNQKAYITKDWSMTGVGLLNFDLNLENKSIIDASIIVVLKEARIEMPVKLEFKSKRGDISGFEFYHISKRNKHVLREFLELSIEGRLDQIDGLLSIYNEPIIETPIKESVVLTDAEESALKRSFAKRSKFYITLAIVFFFLLLATIYYNTTFVYRSVGIVSGNFIRITPSSSGTVKEIYVHLSEHTKKGMLLFELDNSVILSKIDLLQYKIEELKKLIQKPSLPRHSNHTLILLKQDYKTKEKAYLSAKELFQNHFITKNEFQQTYSQYITSKFRYLQLKEKLLKDTNTTKEKVSYIALLTQLELQQKELLEKLKKLRVFSSVDGIVYTSKITKGDFILAGDMSMVIETSQSPFIVCKVKQDEALHIHKGMGVKIYNPVDDTTYDAYVETVGNLSLNTQSHITNEVSLKEVTIKIRLKNDNIHLPLNERVKVWFYRPLL